MRARYNVGRGPGAVPIIIPIYRELMVLVPRITRYTGASGTFGAVTGFLSPNLGISVELGFAMGFILPLGPLVWLCNGEWWIRRELATWKRWETDGVITAAEAEELKQVTLRAMRKHRYGVKEENPPEPVKAKRTRKQKAIE